MHLWEYLVIYEICVISQSYGILSIAFYIFYWKNWAVTVIFFTWQYLFWKHSSDFFPAYFLVLINHLLWAS